MHRFFLSLLVLSFTGISYASAQEEPTEDPYNFLTDSSAQEKFASADEIATEQYLTADLIPLLEMIDCDPWAPGLAETSAAVAASYTDLLEFRASIEQLYATGTWLYMALGGDYPLILYRASEAYVHANMAVADREALLSALANFNARCPLSTEPEPAPPVYEDEEGTGTAEAPELDESQVASVADPCIQLYVDKEQAWMDVDNLTAAIARAKLLLPYLQKQKAEIVALVPTTAQGQKARDIQLVLIQLEINTESRILAKAEAEKPSAEKHAQRLSDRYKRDCRPELA